MISNISTKQLIFNFKLETVFNIMKNNSIEISITELERLMLSNIIKTDCKIQDNNEKNLLIKHIGLGNEEIVKELLQEQEILDIINYSTYDNISRTHIIPITVAVETGNVNILKLLLDNGAKKTRVKTNFRIFKEEECDICLSDACYYGDLECVKLLLQYGADPDMKGIYDSYPLTLACTKGYLDIVKELLKTNKIIINTNSIMEIINFLCMDIRQKIGQDKEKYLKILKELIKYGFLKKNIKKEFEKDIKILKRMNILQMLNEMKQ